MPGDTIRISDLADPVLTEAQQAALDFGDTLDLDLSVDHVLSTAARQTGLADFGPDDFEERLALWLGEVDDDPEATNLFRYVIFTNCVRYAANRLRIHDLLERHPEIHDQEIREPIIVVGLPRSGTTHLVNLMAPTTAQPHMRSMPLWEGQAPVEEDHPTRGPDDPRFVRCQQTWDAMRSTSPAVAAMHPMNPEHIHEELELMLPDFSSYNQEWTARVPRWRDYYLAHDQRPHYRYMRTALKILQWYQPRDRWVLKCPQHLEQLGPLTETFPGATFRRHPPRSGGGDPVGGHDDVLRRPHGIYRHQTRVVPRLLDRTSAPAVGRFGARPPSSARGPHHRRVVSRVHGR